MRSDATRVCTYTRAYTHACTKTCTHPTLTCTKVFAHNIYVCEDHFSKIRLNRTELCKCFCACFVHVSARAFLLFSCQNATVSPGAENRIRSTFSDFPRFFPAHRLGVSRFTCISPSRLLEDLQDPPFLLLYQQGEQLQTQDT